MPTSTAPHATHAAGMTSLAAVRKLIGDMVDSLPEDKLCHQPFEGGNHALWIMGHCAVSDDYFRCTIGETGAATAPEGWQEQFGHGSTPSADASTYPPAAEVRHIFDEARIAFTDWIESLDEAGLNKPMPDDWTGFAPNVAEFPAFVAAHEAMHLGQLMDVRKSLGMAPLM